MKINKLLCILKIFLVHTYCGEMTALESVSAKFFNLITIKVTDDKGNVNNFPYILGSLALLTPAVWYWGKYTIKKRKLSTKKDDNSNEYNEIVLEKIDAISNEKDRGEKAKALMFFEFDTDSILKIRKLACDTPTGNPHIITKGSGDNIKEDFYISLFNGTSAREILPQLHNFGKSLGEDFQTKEEILYDDPQLNFCITKRVVLKEKLDELERKSEGSVLYPLLSKDNSNQIENIFNTFYKKKFEEFNRVFEKNGLKISNDVLADYVGNLKKVKKVEDLLKGSV